MSRGVSFLQVCILDVLAHQRGWVSVLRLALFACHRDHYYYAAEGDYYFEPWGQEPKLTRSEYVAVHRAVKSMERRGLVKTQVNTHPGGLGSGGCRRDKVVRPVSVDSRFPGMRYQHLAVPSEVAR